MVTNSTLVHVRVDCSWLFNNYSDLKKVFLNNFLQHVKKLIALASCGGCDPKNKDAQGVTIFSTMFKMLNILFLGVQNCHNLWTVSLCKQLPNSSKHYSCQLHD